MRLYTAEILFETYKLVINLCCVGSHLGVTTILLPIDNVKIHHCITWFIL
jgi:hypothetical protein